MPWHGWTGATVMDSADPTNIAVTATKYNDPLSGKGEWVNLRFPNAFAHPFSFRAATEQPGNACCVTIPKGVVLEDGRDVGVEPERARDPWAWPRSARAVR